MKKIILIAAPLAAILVVVLFTGARAYRMAAATSVEEGVTVTCEIDLGNSTLAVGTDADPDAENVVGSGSASFVSVGNTENSTDLAPVSLSFTGNDPIYGEFNFEFDPAREGETPISTVASNQADSDFPATAHIYAHVRGTVSGLEGTYASTEPLHIASSSLQSFNPHVDEPYTVVEDLTFEPLDGHTGASFTIPAGSVVVLR